MRRKTDRRTSIEKSVDNYIDRLLIATGEKNPVRRKAFERDVHYALQIIEPFRERYNKAMAYDIYAVDTDFTQAVMKVKEAAEILETFGLHILLPPVIENPDIVEAECAIALIDTLRSLDAIQNDVAEEFVSEVLDDVLRRSSAGGKEQHPQTEKFILRYIHEKISEDELDAIAMVDDYLETYIKRL